jgi:hypothetical protein
MWFSQLWRKGCFYRIDELFFLTNFKTATVAELQEHKKLNTLIDL